jgi:hypothetical protein
MASSGKICSLHAFLPNFDFSDLMGRFGQTI